MTESSRKVFFRVLCTCCECSVFDWRALAFSCMHFFWLHSLSQIRTCFSRCLFPHVFTSRCLSPTSARQVRPTHFPLPRPLLSFTHPSSFHFPLPNTSRVHRRDVPQESPLKPRGFGFRVWSSGLGFSGAGVQAQKALGLKNQ